MSSKRILIADDSVVFLKALSGLLQAKGYQVLTAADGASVISIVRREKPDLILLDINFPPDVAHGGGVSWDGFRIMYWLRRMDEAKRVPIIVITAGDLAKERDRCGAFEVAGFFRKPVDHDELLATIRRALEGKTAAEPLATELLTARKILFVDDEKDWCYMAAMYLADSGYEVLTATNAAEALRQAEKVAPDLVVLDLDLGGESGLAVMKLLKAKYPEVPVLLYTARDHDEAEVQAMLRDGAHQYLRKSTMGEMVRAIQVAASRLPPRKPAAHEQARERTAPALEPDPESVLLLEDDAVFGETVQRFLESHSFRVTRVANGAEGLRQITAADFDVILCDLVMPNLPGDLFYLAVERIKPHLCKRFVFMTGHRADPNTEGFIRRVRGPMLWKPFPLADLLTAIAVVWKKTPAAGGSRSLPAVA